MSNPSSVFFGDLSQLASLTKLNDHLATRSYIHGYTPSEADSFIINSMKGAPAERFIHVWRWYKHIKANAYDRTHGQDRKEFFYQFFIRENERRKEADALLRDQELRAQAAAAATTNNEESAKAAAKPVKDDAKLEETAKAAAKPVKDDEDDDVDLFGSDEEDNEEAEKLKEERLKAYNEKKSKKPGVIAKSSVILDVKPWDDETDMKAIEEKVRGITLDGLVWGASKLVPVGYGIKKLQIMSVVEDEKVSIDWLQEEIQNFEDLVQSVDIAAFNKI